MINNDGTVEFAHKETANVYEKLIQLVNDKSNEVEATCFLPKRNWHAV